MEGEGSGQDRQDWTLVRQVHHVSGIYIYKNRKPRGGMEDGTWNKALCFVYITCTIGSVGGI